MGLQLTPQLLHKCEADQQGRLAQIHEVGNLGSTPQLYSSCLCTGVTKMPSAGPRVKKLRSPSASSVSCPGDSLNVNLRNRDDQPYDRDALVLA